MKLDLSTKLIEHMERIAQDTKKRFSYSKSKSTWAWYDSDEDDQVDAWHTGFATRLDALADAVAPELRDACVTALAHYRASFPEEHGNPVIGEAWGKLEAAIGKAQTPLAGHSGTSQTPSSPTSKSTSTNRNP